MQLITEPRSEGERWLVDTVRRQAEKAGHQDARGRRLRRAGDQRLRHRPQPQQRAGRRCRPGLLRAMDRDEAEAVLGHEISHVANGDMVTMTLLQGVLNTFVIFLSRVVGRIIDGCIGGGRDGPGIGYFLIVMVLDMVFGLFASMIAMWFSRHREFRADAGGAELAGRGKMIARCASSRTTSHRQRCRARSPRSASRARSRMACRDCSAAIRRWKSALRACSRRRRSPRCVSRTRY
jgi:heat shock protein HtpX